MSQERVRCEVRVRVLERRTVQLLSGARSLFHCCSAIRGGGQEAVQPLESLVCTASHLARLTDSRRTDSESLLTVCLSDYLLSDCLTV